MVLESLVAVHAPELCVLLAQPPQLAPSGAKALQPKPPDAPNNSSNQSSRRPSRQHLRRPVAYGVSKATVAVGHTEARDTVWDAVVAPLASVTTLSNLAGPEPFQPPSPPSPPSRRGCFRGCGPAWYVARGTARRPAPNLPTAERAAAQSKQRPPLVFGWPSERIGTDSLHRLLCAAQHAWRGHGTRERLASALVLRSAVGMALSSSSSSSSSGGGNGGNEDARWQGEVLLACAPLLLFAKVSVELPAPKHNCTRLTVDEEERQERAIAGSVAAAVREWSRPLSLVLAFLHRIRPGLEVLASSGCPSQPAVHT